MEREMREWGDQEGLRQAVEGMPRVTLVENDKAAFLIADGQHDRPQDTSFIKYVQGVSFDLKVVSYASKAGAEKTLREVMKPTIDPFSWHNQPVSVLRAMIEQGKPAYLTDCDMKFFPTLRVLVGDPTLQLKAAYHRLLRAYQNMRRDDEEAGTTTQNIRGRVVRTLGSLVGMSNRRPLSKNEFSIHTDPEFFLLPFRNLVIAQKLDYISTRGGKTAGPLGEVMGSAHVMGNGYHNIVNALRATPAERLELIGAARPFLQGVVNDIRTLYTIAKLQWNAANGAWETEEIFEEPELKRIVLV